MVDSTPFAGHAGPVRAVALAPGGDRLFTAGHDGVARLWSISGGRLIRAFGGHDRHLNAVAVTPDGSTLLTAGFDRVVRVWDVDSGALRQTMAAHEREVRAVAIFPDGATAVSAGFDGVPLVWDIASGTVRHRLGAVKPEEDFLPVREPMGIGAVAVAHDGEWLLTLRFDGTVERWDTVTGQLAFTAEHCARPFGEFILGPDQILIGSLLIAPDDGWFLTGNASSFEPISSHADGSPPASQFGAFGVFDTTDGRLLALSEELPANVYAAALADGGDTVVTVDGRLQVSTWDRRGGRVTSAVAAETTGAHGDLHAVAVTADGARIVTAGDDGTARAPPDHRRRRAGIRRRRSGRPHQRRRDHARRRTRRHGRQRRHRAGLGPDDRNPGQRVPRTPGLDSAGS